MVNAWTKVFYGYPVIEISPDDEKKARAEEDSCAEDGKRIFYNIGGHSDTDAIANKLGYIIYREITPMGYNGDNPTLPVECPLLKKPDRKDARRMIRSIIERFPSIVVGKLSVVVVTEWDI